MIVGVRSGFEPDGGASLTFGCVSLNVLDSRWAQYHPVSLDPANSDLRPGSQCRPDFRSGFPWSGPRELTSLLWKHVPIPQGSLPLLV